MSPHRVIALAAASWTLVAVSAQAQCSHLSGNPPPAAALGIAEKVVLRNKGVPGDSKFRLLKGQIDVGAGFGFQPNAIHGIALTFRIDSLSNPVAMAVQVDPGPDWKSLGNGKWRYTNLNPSTNGVKKIVLEEVSGFLNIKRFLGQNVTVPNPAPGFGLHVMLEVYNTSNAGVCVAQNLPDNHNGSVFRP